MKLLRTFILVCVPSLLLAQAPSFEWAYCLGTNGNYGTDGRSVVVDDSGYVYTVGKFSQVVDFDPSSSTYNLTSVGGADVFVTKTTSNGQFVWVKQIGGTSDEYAIHVSLANDTSLLVTGFFNGTCDFDPSSATFNVSTTGVTDAYVCKLSTGGDLIWVKTFGGTSATNAYSSQCDQNGNVVVVGAFWATTDFDPGAGTSNMTSAGNRDVFVVKLDSEGAFIWSKRIGASGSDAANSNAIDPFGNIILTGNFIGTVDFDPGAGVHNLTGIGGNGFLLRLNQNGEFSWAGNFGGSSTDNAFGVVCDDYGSVYFTGNFTGTQDFDFESGVFNLQSAGTTYSDAFVCAYDSSGTLKWAKSFKGSFYGSDVGKAIVLDEDRNVYTTGYFLDIVDFDPGPDTFLLGTSGLYSTDILISKLDSMGDFVWAVGMGNDEGCQGLGIAIDAFSNVYTTGVFEDSVDFDPGSGTYMLAATGSHDAFVHKLGLCSPVFQLVIEESCETYTSPSGNHVWTQSGIYNDTVAAVGGCDSILTIDLTVNQPDFTSESHSSCLNYFWPVTGQTYNSSGQYSGVLTNSNGCDSTITLNLTIMQNATSSESQISCNAYTWPANNQTYNASGTYSETFVASNGCDSIVTLNLTIPELDPSYVFFIDSATLEAVQLGVNYEWFNCDTVTQQMVPFGDTARKISIWNGFYALVVTSDGCSDTSDCQFILVEGIDETFAESIRIYPNPTYSAVTVTGTHPLNTGVDLVDALGNIVHCQKSFIGQGIELDLRKLENGVYFVRVSSKSGVAVKSVIKQ